MRLIHEEGGFSLEERTQYVVVVHSNTIQSLMAVIRAMDKLQLQFSDPDRKVGDSDWGGGGGVI